MKGIAPKRFGWLIVVAAVAVLAVILAAICQDPFSYTARMHGLMRILDARSLSEGQKVNAAEVVVKNRVNVQPGERVLLIVQNEGERRLVGKYLEAQVRDLKAIPTVIYQRHPVQASVARSLVRHWFIGLLFRGASGGLSIWVAIFFDSVFPVLELPCSRYRGSAIAEQAIVFAKRLGILLSWLVRHGFASIAS